MTTRFNNRRNRSGASPLGTTWSVLSTVILLLAVMALPEPAEAQGTVRAWGMGGAHTALSRGLASVQYNPANLAFSEGMNIGLAAAALDVHNNAISLDRYNEITGGHLNQTDKTALLADIPQDGFRLDANARASALGIQSGPYAFSINALGAGQGNLDKDYFDLVLFGNSLGETVDFSNTWGEGYALGSATFSYGQLLLESPLGRLSIGANARYLQGIYEMHVEDAYGSLTTSLTGISGEAFVSTVSSDGGSGYGLDLGFGLQTPGGWTLGLVLDNLLTRIDWTSSVETNQFRVAANDISIINGDLDSAVANTDTTYFGDPYHTSLPRRVRLGAAKNLGPVAVAVDYIQGFANRGITSKTPQLNAGVEWWPTGKVRPRLGASAGGVKTAGISAGLGLRFGPWCLDLAAVSRGGTSPGGANGLGLAAGSSLVF